jgi:hypothetical protein
MITTTMATGARNLPDSRLGIHLPPIGLFARAQKSTGVFLIEGLLRLLAVCTV